MRCKQTYVFSCIILSYDMLKETLKSLWLEVLWSVSLEALEPAPHVLRLSVLSLQLFLEIKPKK